MTPANDSPYMLSTVKDRSVVLEKGATVFMPFNDSVEVILSVTFIHISKSLGQQFIHVLFTGIVSRFTANARLDFESHVAIVVQIGRAPSADHCGAATTECTAAILPSSETNVRGSATATNPSTTKVVPHFFQLPDQALQRRRP
jgi:hypothetical protein